MEGFLIPIDSDLPDPDQKGSGDSIKVTRRVHPVSTQLVGPKTVFFVGFQFMFSTSAH